MVQGIPQGAVETTPHILAGNPAAAAGGLPLLAYDVVYASLLAEQGLLREALAYVSAVQVRESICSKVVSLSRQVV